MSPEEGDVPDAALGELSIGFMKYRLDIKLTTRTGMNVAGLTATCIGAPCNVLHVSQ